jgi:hypothetical protein
MKLLYEEMCRRFPEVRSFIGEDEDLPYIVMGGLADWVRSLPTDQISPQLVARVDDFAEWCFNFPRGESAEDDILTMWQVAFFEKIFRSPSSRLLIPHLTTKADLLANAEHLKCWVEIEDYEAALRLFD